MQDSLKEADMQDGGTDWESPTKRRKDGSWLHSSVYMAYWKYDWVLIGDRCGHWAECGIPEYHHRMAVRYQVRTLHHGILSERELLLLGRRQW